MASSASDWFRAYVEDAEGVRTVVRQELGDPATDGPSWSGVTVPLTPWAGQTIRIVFEAEFREILGLDPTFPLKYMIYFLIVVSVVGTSSITGPLLAALLLGIADVAGKYFIPKMGAFTVYLLMIVILLWRPQGLFGKR